MTLYIRQPRILYTLKQSLNFVQPGRSALKTQSKEDCFENAIYVVQRGVTGLFQNDDVTLT